jgi:hypothetical protein
MVVGKNDIIQEVCVRSVRTKKQRLTMSNWAPFSRSQSSKRSYLSIQGRSTFLDWVVYMVEKGKSARYYPEKNQLQSTKHC